MKITTYKKPDQGYDVSYNVTDDKVSVGSEPLTNLPLDDVIKHTEGLLMVLKEMKKDAQASKDAQRSR